MVFESEIIVAIQSVFHSEMNQNNIFLFLKKSFLTSTQSENTQKKFEVKKINKIQFFSNMLLKHKNKQGLRETH
jgi:hypothetical protein